ncbi:hypothetical protein [Pseudooceanicola onchidii]|uniref:hypothetical protein n=1 Tax=Pseudooceanicola onchidii TaxID=2562279 RepID=UPI001F0CFF1E|nr:hypothetical protein [Pseudooceanicola onchidii]
MTWHERKSLKGAHATWQNDLAAGRFKGILPMVPWLFLGLVLVFGAVQLQFWNGRSLWIDEVSQLLNAPLDNLAQAFGPLPRAQQAAPPLFNLLLHAVSGLSIEVMRSAMVAVTLSVVLIAMLAAYGPRPLQITAGLFVLLSHPRFLEQATMLKFYGLEIAGFAIFTAWIYARRRTSPLGPGDALILLAGMLFGISTIVGACIVVALFLALRLGQGDLCLREVLIAGLLGLFAVGYYLQIRYATALQLSSFPDAYGARSLAAVLNFADALWQLLTLKAAAVLLVVVAILLTGVMLLRDTAQSQLAGVMLFATLITVVFIGLAAIGKYPASTIRHLVWILGVYSILTGVALCTLLQLWVDERRIPAIAGTVLLGGVLAANGMREVSKWPPQIAEGATSHLVTALAKIPPSTVITYYGALRMIPLELARGTQIGQHSYAPAVSLLSGPLDPAYFNPDWMEMEATRVSDKMQAILANDPHGWIKMSVLLRLRQDFRPLARFVLDAAPADNIPFHIVALHVLWDEVGTDRRAADLQAELDARLCSYAAVANFRTVRSPGFLLEVRCP